MSQGTTSCGPILSAVICVLVIGLAFTSHASAEKLEFILGSGYDYLSSDFYLLSEDTLAINPDSLDQLKRTFEATNEFSIFAKAKYNHAFSDISRMEIYNRTAVGNQSFRSNLDFRMYVGALRITNYLILSSLDGDEEEGLNHNYLTNLTSGTIRPHLGDNFYFVARNSFEFTRYDHPGGYFYDYNLNKLNLWIEKDLGFSGRIGVGFRNDLKRVSDSVNLNYDRNALLLSVDYSPEWKYRLYLDNELSFKNSNRADNIDDETLNNLELSFTYHPNFNLSVRLYNQLEYSKYKEQDFVYFNQLYYKGYLEFRESLSDNVQLSLTPHYRKFKAIDSEYDGQDFYEYTLEPGFEYMMGTRLWVDASFEFGKRKYSHPTSGLFTDNNLYKFNLLFDAFLTKHVAVNVLSSIDWERHEIESDNTTLYLISTALEYRF